jgi:pSer/pThr/pTyr-binding forkhead associated (FHA) protein
MSKVTFQVLEGVDKGRVFRELPTPVTIGREEGNALRLNDERVSRFHAKIQQDNDDIILTDLESTNGTRVNGMVVQIRRLRLGDRVAIGRSLLLYGSNQEIAARMANQEGSSNLPTAGQGAGAIAQGPATIQALTSVDPAEQDFDFDLNLGKERATVTNDAIFLGNRTLPPLPLRLSPSQAARLAEIFEFLHHGLVQGTENIEAKEDGSHVNLSYADWQRIQAVQMLLARYWRAIAEPDTLGE